MTHTAISPVTAFLLLFAFTLMSLSSTRGGNGKFHLMLAATIAAVIYWISSRDLGLGLPTALLASILATLIAFGVVQLFSRGNHQLGVLLGPYLCIMAILMIWTDAQSDEAAWPAELSSWLSAHIATSVLSYGFATVGAIASLAIILRERSLNLRIRNRFSDRLPSIAAAEKAEIFGLATAECILGLGIILGIAAEFTSSGELFKFTHKNLFSVAAFVLLAGFLYLHLQTGLRGRLAARIGLTVYLLISLGYPGVKFVSEFLLN